LTFFVFRLFRLVFVLRSTFFQKIKLKIKKNQKKIKKSSGSTFFEKIKGKSKIFLKKFFR